MWGHLWTVELTHIYSFAFKFTLRYLHPDSHCLPPVANLPPVSTTLVKLVAKFAAGVVDTGDKFAAGVVDTGGKFATGVVNTGGQP